MESNLKPGYLIIQDTDTGEIYEYKKCTECKRRAALYIRRVLPTNIVQGYYCQPCYNRNSPTWDQGFVSEPIDFGDIPEPPPPPKKFGKRSPSSGVPTTPSNIETSETPKQRTPEEEKAYRQAWRNNAEKHSKEFEDVHGIPLPLSPPSVIPHGTVSGYSYHKCRCDACRAFWNNYQKERRGIRGDKPTGPTLEEYQKQADEWMKEIEEAARQQNPDS